MPSSSSIIIVDYIDFFSIRGGHVLSLTPAVLVHGLPPGNSQVWLRVVARLDGPGQNMIGRRNGANIMPE